jgi:DNA-binding NarL/FixJ family response regulator
MIDILLVDDHKIVRDGIKALLFTNGLINIVGECDDGNQVLEFCENNHVDIILMDINMQDVNGIDCTKMVNEKYPTVKIIALTMHIEEGYISKILKSGAAGYILKNTGKTELIDAIKKVNNGENYFSKEVSNVMMNKYMKKSGIRKSSSSLASVDDLTKREVEILGLIAEELTNNEIGEKLFISPRTVDTHRRNLLQKLGVKNTAGLVKFALQNGIYV